MKKDTAEFIKQLLMQEVILKQSRMMDCINNKFDTYLKDRIDEYRKAYDAQDDFCEWLDDQKFEEGGSK